MVEKKDITNLSEDEIAEFWDENEIVDYLDEAETVNIKFIDKRPTKKRTTIYLSAEEHNEVRQLAHEERISMAKYIRKAINYYKKHVKAH